jgi:hypothetical protein
MATENNTTNDFNDRDDIRSLCALALQPGSVEANGYWAQVKRIAFALVKDNVTDEAIREALDLNADETEIANDVIYAATNFRMARGVK